MIGSLVGVHFKLARANDPMLTPEEFGFRIRGYFEHCDSNFKAYELKGKIHYEVKPYTLTGLIAFMGFTKSMFNRYARVPEYAEMIEYAMLLIENNVEEGMMNNTLNPIASIFSLKNRFGWQDKVDIQQSKDITVNIVQNEAEVIKLADGIDDEATMLALKESGMNFDKMEGDYEQD